MKVLIDTSVWSLALRRRPRVENEEVVRELAALVDDGRVVMIGPVRQELLSGLRERAQFERLREHLRAFRDLELTRTTKRPHLLTTVAAATVFRDRTQIF